jgi:hypothetical protein
MALDTRKMKLTLKTTKYHVYLHVLTSFFWIWSEYEEKRLFSLFSDHYVSIWLVVWTHLKNMKVNGKDDIPNMKWKNNPNVPNHQSAYIYPDI